MVSSKRPIFREQAVQQYLQRRQPDVLPRFISPLLFLSCWVLLVLLVIALILLVPAFSTFLKG
ncbi:MAG TPA: hypothetical protein VFV38_36815 [Ktedonobacteraceae bacterium]|nr:hypothetical protein [Ktedonobacteraceae bacterium]